MIKVEVKTLYNGNVGVRGKYVRLCLDSGEALQISHGNGVMLLLNQNIERKTLGLSPNIRDKWGKAGDRLHYFKWEPTHRQQALMAL